MNGIERGKISVAATERTFPLMSRVPESIREMLARRMRELAGTRAGGARRLAAVALATWSVQDPSLSHATSKPVRNLLGDPGAITADLLMQTFGLGAIMLLLPVSIWGWRMLTHRHFDREALRIAFWILAAVLCAGFASCLPRSGAWPLPSGLGGVTGDALLRLPASLIGADGFFTRLILGLVFAIATVVTFVVASGAGSREKTIEDDYEEEVEEEEGEDEPAERDTESRRRSA